MSAIAQPAAVFVARAPGEETFGLGPSEDAAALRCGRYKGMTALGLMTLTLMGLVGALPQLIIGMITDCLQGSPHTLTTSAPARRAHRLARCWRFMRR